MEIKSLYPVIVVENLKETKDFYCNILGFSVKHEITRKDNGKVLVLANEKGLQLEVMETMKDGPIQLPLGLEGFRMNVDDIAAAREELLANGFTQVTDIFDTPASRNMIFKDNNGINITLMQHIKK